MLTANEVIFERLPQIEGWLNNPAAVFTDMLMQHQTSIGITGPIAEFGVYHGKYLALLYALAQMEDRVVGIDAFVNMNEPPATSMERVSANVRLACDDNARLTVIHEDLSQLTAARILEYTGGPVRFLSVDAGHAVENVLNDLALSAQILLPGGIIAIDDAFSHHTPGVIEGVCRYFLAQGILERVPPQEHSLAPFAECYNKLFVTTVSHADMYFGRTLQFVSETAEQYEFARNTLVNIRGNTANSFSTRLFGREIVCFM
jgi:hypothetical protein